MIKVNHLTRCYGEVIAVNDVSVEIGRGEIVGLLGHNGAGKTTIMKMVTGYLEPTSGEIRIDDLTIGRDTAKIQARIGYLPESCPLWPEMSVLDYLEYHSSLHSIPAAKRKQCIASAIRRTELIEKALQKISTLSRGYRQRLGVAQAILHEPDIIILDEPTNGLDPTQILHMRDLVEELALTATVIISTHILQEVQAVCQRVVIMQNGQLAVDARMDELQNEQRLLLTIDRDLNQELSQLKGVAKAELHNTKDNKFTFALSAKQEYAPSIAAAVHSADAKLYALTCETHSLEKIFTEMDEAKAKDNANDKNKAKQSVTPNA